jgi:hypothetical protein
MAMVAPAAAQLSLYDGSSYAAGEGSNPYEDQIVPALRRRMPPFRVITLREADALLRSSPRVKGIV